MIVANLGDCRAVMCRNGKALNLSVDHKPNREDERSRIEKAGGWIETAEVLNIPRLYRLHLEDEELVEETEELVGWVEVHRVNSCLGMTRSIGDILIKDKKKVQFKKDFLGELVLAEPEIQEGTITDKDEFILIACDGVWDVFTSQEAVDFVHSSLIRKKSCQLIAEELVEMAIELGSLDNVTAIILFLNHR